MANTLNLKSAQDYNKSAALSLNWKINPANVCGIKSAGDADLAKWVYAFQHYVLCGGDRSKDINVSLAYSPCASRDGMLGPETIKALKAELPKHTQTVVGNYLSVYAGYLKDVLDLGATKAAPAPGNSGGSSVPEPKPGSGNTNNNTVTVDPKPVKKTNYFLWAGVAGLVGLGLWFATKED
jgi:hypothetical protein